MPVYGVVRSEESYTLEQMMLIQGCGEKAIKKFLGKHGYRTSCGLGRGKHQIAGYVWNLCVQRDMLEGRTDGEE